MFNFFLKIQVLSQNAAARLRTQDGAETIQVIMIMGIMALIIAAVFLSSGGLGEQIEALGTRVSNAIQDIS